MDLGEKLYELRKAKNLTQDDVAEKINVTRQTVSKWETNQSVPDFDKIVPLCDLFEISTDELLKGKKEESENEDASIINDEPKMNFFEKAKEKNRLDYESMTANQIKQKSAEVVSTSILIFFLAVCVLIGGIAGLGMNPVIAVVWFLMLIGWGTIRIVKHYMSVPDLERTEEEKKKDKVEKELTDVIMGITTAIYFIVSFTTMAWYITWVIFIIGDLVTHVAKLGLTLKGGDDNEE